MQASFILNRYRIYVLLYIFSALLIGVTKGEIRPIFSGNWFFKTPFILNDFGLKIIEIEGLSIEKSFYVDQYQGKDLSYWRYDAYKLEQQLGQFISEKNTQGAFGTIQQIKKVLFLNRNFKFEVYKRSSNIRDFIENQKLLKEEIIYSSQDQK